MRVLKNLVPAVALMAVASSVLAQSYGGLSAAYVRNSTTCPKVSTAYCSAKPLGMLLYSGSKLPESSQFDFGIGKIDGFEAGLMTLGAKSLNVDTIKSRVSGGRTVTTVTTDSYLMSGNALYGAALTHMDLMDSLQMTVRLGVSYVSTTLKTERNHSVSLGSSTDNRWQPFVGVGVEYKIIDELSVVSRLDMTRMSADSRNGLATLLSVGAQFNY